MTDDEVEIEHLRKENQRLASDFNFECEQRKKYFLKLAITVEALQWYADPFKIMNHIDGTYTIHDDWYEKARQALAAIKGA